MKRKSQHLDRHWFRGHEQA